MPRLDTHLKCVCACVPDFRSALLISKTILTSSLILSPHTVMHMMYACVWVSKHTLLFFLIFTSTVVYMYVMFFSVHSWPCLMITSETTVLFHYRGCFLQSIRIPARLKVHMCTIDGCVLFCLFNYLFLLLHKSMNNSTNSRLSAIGATHHFSTWRATHRHLRPKRLLVYSLYWM